MSAAFEVIQTYQEKTKNNKMNTFFYQFTPPGSIKMPLVEINV